MPGPARGLGMGRRGRTRRPPWEEEADRAWARGQEALCLHPLRRDGLAAFIGGPIPAAGGLGCMTMLMIPAVLLVAILVLLLL